MSIIWSRSIASLSLVVHLGHEHRERRDDGRVTEERETDEAGGAAGERGEEADRSDLARADGADLEGDGLAGRTVGALGADLEGDRHAVGEGDLAGAGELARRGHRVARRHRGERLAGAVAHRDVTTSAARDDDVGAGAASDHDRRAGRAEDVVGEGEVGVVADVEALAALEVLHREDLAAPAHRHLDRVDVRLDLVRGDGRAVLHQRERRLLLRRIHEGVVREDLAGRHEDVGEVETGCEGVGGHGFSAASRGRQAGVEGSAPKARVRT